MIINVTVQLTWFLT